MYSALRIARRCISIRGPEAVHGPLLRKEHVENHFYLWKRKDLNFLSLHYHIGLRNHWEILLIAGYTHRTASSSLSTQSLLPNSFGMCIAITGTSRMVSFCRVVTVIAWI